MANYTPIGTGETHTDPQSWEAALPSSLSDDEIGEMHDEPFDFGSSSLTFSGSITFNGHSIILQAADGNGTLSKSAYDGTAGSGPVVRNNRGGSWAIIEVNYDVTLEGFEVTQNGSAGSCEAFAARTAGATLTAKRMLAHGVTDDICDSFSGDGVFQSCLFYDYGGHGSIESNTDFDSCTFIKSETDGNNSNAAVRFGQAINCAAFHHGPQSGWRDYLNLAAGSSNNASHDTSGSAGLQSLVAADEFENLTGFADLHPASGSALLGAGTPTVGFDITGAARDGANPTVGAFENVASSGLTASIGLASSGSTAFALGRAKLRTVGLATGGSAAFAPVAVKSRLVGLAAAGSTAFALAWSRLRVAGLASSGSAAFGLGKSKSRATGLASGASTAFALAAAKSRVVGLASSASSALAFGASKLRTLGVAVSASAAFAVSVAGGAIKVVIGLATSASSAFPVGRGKRKATGLAASASSAGAAGAAKRRPVGLAAAASTAFALGRAKARSIGQAISAAVAFLVNAIGGAGITPGRIALSATATTSIDLQARAANSVQLGATALTTITLSARPA